MVSLSKCLVAAGLLIASVPSNLHAFALLGPFKDWQVQRIGYRLGGDIGGPTTPLEAYRWNVPLITYAFDESFLRYFGANGVAAVDEAIKIFNDLPPATQVNLDNYPLDTKLSNPTAEAAGLLDLKSYTMRILLEELGLAEAERWVWALRSRVIINNVTNFTTINLNYDPVTLRPSRFVNGVPYGFEIFDGQVISDAEEFVRVDPFPNVPFSSVSGSFPFTGQFYFGLTRDDVGGLRFLLHTNNIVTEGLIGGITSQGTATRRNFSYIPYFGTTNFGQFGSNFLNTNLTGNFITNGLRGGVNKITFQKVQFDSLLGQSFTAVTNRYRDGVLAGGRLVSQPVQRAITEPDIVFVVEDIGLSVIGTPLLYSRTGTAGWINNDALNGRSAAFGPGVIQGPVQIAFTDQLPYYHTVTPFLTDQDIGGSGIFFDGAFVWGSFDESDTPPIIYPRFLELTVEDILNAANRRN